MKYTASLTSIPMSSAAFLRNNGGPIRLPLVLHAQDDPPLLRGPAPARGRAAFASLLLQGGARRHPSVPATVRPAAAGCAGARRARHR